MKKKSIIKKPNFIIYGFFKLVSKIIAKLNYNLIITKNELKGVKGPYVVIANHESVIDFLNMAAATKKRTHFVISNAFYNSLSIKPLIKSCGCIPKQQFQTSIVDMKTMKYVLDQGRPLVIYPAGLMSENGLSTPIPSGTAKMLKWFNQDVYVAYTKGSYLSNPKWSSIRRKGRITLEITKLYSKEDIKEISIEEIQNTVIKKLDFDSYENNIIDKIEYKNGDNIEGLENVLYWCPKCGCEFTLNSNKNIMTCSNCNNTIKADRFGLLHKNGDDDIVYHKPSDWSLAILNNLREEIIENEQYFLYDSCDIQMINYKKHKFQYVGNGNIKLNREGFILNANINNEEKTISLPISYFPILPFKPNKYFEIQEGNDIYRIFISNSKMVTKWINSLKILFQLKIEKK